VILLCSKVNLVFLEPDLAFVFEQGDGADGEEKVRLPSRSPKRSSFQRQARWGGQGLRLPADGSGDSYGTDEQGPRAIGEVRAVRFWIW
jgi:hypothetical protein